MNKEQAHAPRIEAFLTAAANRFCLLKQVPLNHLAEENVLRNLEPKDAATEGHPKKRWKTIMSQNPGDKATLMSDGNRQDRDL